MAALGPGKPLYPLTLSVCVYNAQGELPKREAGVSYPHFTDMKAEVVSREIVTDEACPCAPSGRSGAPTLSLLSNIQV